MVGTRASTPVSMVWAQGGTCIFGDSGDADDKNHGTRLMEVLGARPLRGRGGLWVFGR